MDIKKIDFKTWAIIILGVALIISFFFGQRNKIDYKKDEIEALHKSNEALTKSNDSLLFINKQIDKEISEISLKLSVNDSLLTTTKTELDKLKKRKNEILTNVNNLSANGVADAFSDYLQTKSTNTH